MSGGESWEYMYEVREVLQISPYANALGSTVLEVSKDRIVIAKYDGRRWLLGYAPIPEHVKQIVEGQWRSRQNGQR